MGAGFYLCLTGAILITLGLLLGIVGLAMLR